MWNSSMEVQQRKVFSKSLYSKDINSLEILTSDLCQNHCDSNINRQIVTKRKAKKTFMKAHQKSFTKNRENEFS